MLINGAHYLTWELSWFYCYCPYAHVHKSNPETQSADTSIQSSSAHTQQRVILPHAPVRDERRKSHANNILLRVNTAHRNLIQKGKGLAFQNFLRHLDIWLLLKVNGRQSPGPFVYLFLENSTWESTYGKGLPGCAFLEQKKLGHSIHAFILITFSLSIY